MLPNQPNWKVQSWQQPQQQPSETWRQNYRSQELQAPKQYNQAALQDAMRRNLATSQAMAPQLGGMLPASAAFLGMVQGQQLAPDALQWAHDKAVPALEKFGDWAGQDFWKPW